MENNVYSNNYTAWRFGRIVTITETETTITIDGKQYIKLEYIETYGEYVDWNTHYITSFILKDADNNKYNFELMCDNAQGIENHFYAEEYGLTEEEEDELPDVFIKLIARTDSEGGDN